MMQSVTKDKTSEIWKERKKEKKIACQAQITVIKVEYKRWD